ncbi:MAG: polysaccharide deacetylase family protein [Thermoproteota archaeon]|nr:polysaccharide deacetylase family protein [Thermoproteota archaeon]
MKSSRDSFQVLFLITIAILIFIAFSGFSPSVMVHSQLTSNDSAKNNNKITNFVDSINNKNGSIANSSSGTKIVMINFDDGWKTQMTFAKPILDKYGIKASFFVVCNYVTSGDAKRMNWQDIAALQRDGMDIESHTMDHKPLNKMSLAKLDSEVGGSKQCLANHGVNTTIFGYPFNLGSDKPSVVNVVAKYYNLGRSGTDPLMFLNCNGYLNHPQTDCSTYSANGKLNYVNRYNIRSASFYHVSGRQNFSPPEMFQKFLQILNSQIAYNSQGKINAIPVVVYHNITNNIQDYTPASKASVTTVDLFAQEMKYLHDNGFKVLLLNRLGFDTTKNVFYLNNTSGFTTAPTTSTRATTMTGLGQ